MKRFLMTNEKLGVEEYRVFKPRELHENAQELYLNGRKVQIEDLAPDAGYVARVGYNEARDISIYNICMSLADVFNKG